MTNKRMKRDFVVGPRQRSTCKRRNSRTASSSSVSLTAFSARSERSRSAAANTFSRLFQRSLRFTRADLVTARRRFTWLSRYGLNACAQKYGQGALVEKQTGRGRKKNSIAYTCFKPSSSRRPAYASPAHFVCGTVCGRRDALHITALFRHVSSRSQVPSGVSDRNAVPASSAATLYILLRSPPPLYIFHRAHTHARHRLVLRMVHAMSYTAFGHRPLSPPSKTSRV